MSWQNLNLFLSFFREMTHGYNDESREFIIKLKIKRTPPLDTFWKNFISWGIVCKIFATLPWTVSQQVAVCEISRYCWDLGMAANLDYFSNPVSNQISDFISGLNLDFGFIPDLNFYEIRIWNCFRSGLATIDLKYLIYNCHKIIKISWQFRINFWVRSHGISPVNCQKAHIL